NPSQCGKHPPAVIPRVQRNGVANIFGLRGQGAANSDGWTGNCQAFGSRLIHADRFVDFAEIVQSELWNLHARLTCTEISERQIYKQFLAGVLLKDQIFADVYDLE